MTVGHPAPEARDDVSGGGAPLREENGMTGPRFATLGDNTIDQYFGATNESFVGGNAVNVAVQLAALGDDVRYAGAVGADRDGQRVRSALHQRGVGVELLVDLPGVTSISQIQVQRDGDRRIGFEDFAVCADYRPSAAAYDAVADAAIVHLGWTPFGGEIRRELSSRGVAISQDCAVTAGFDHLDIAFGSAGENVEAARIQAIEALAGGAALAIVTMGAAGSIGFDGESWFEQAAEPAEVVDTTGAGDAFIAGFLHEWARSADVPAALASGARNAARACGHPGGFAQQPEPLDITSPRGTLRDRAQGHEPAVMHDEGSI